MKVSFYSTLRSAAGGKSVVVDLPGPATAQQVLEAATRARPALGEELWKAPGELKGHIRVFVNGREVHFLPMGLQTTLEAKDILDVFPPVGGGA